MDNIEKTNEKIVILELCKICDDNKQELTELLKPELDYPYILGHLMFNRVAALAYIKLKEYDLFKRLNREFVNSLKGIYTASKLTSDGFKTFLGSLSYILKDENKPYALLKGSFLSSLYPEGTRTSNDVDLLINKEDATHFVELFKSYGYEQGFIRGGEFVAATRKDIIESRMNFGETVPLIKNSEMTNLKYFEVDLNFSLDYKAKQENDLVSKLLEGREFIIDTYKDRLPTLEKADFLIFLCLHLYKEATVYEWVARERDMTLYKFVDIYLLLNKYATSEYISNLQSKIQTYGFEKECYFAIYNTCQLFDIMDPKILSMLERIKPAALSFMKRIIDPKGKKSFTYDMNIKEWVFTNNRVSFLNS